MSAAVKIAPVSGPNVAVVSGGSPGAAGADGGVLQRTAAQALGGHRVVRASGGDTVDYASASDPLHADLIVGLTTAAASNGADVTVRTAGEMQESGWAWTPGAPVFCGLNGVLTQTPPASGFIRQIGFADAPDRIVIDLRPPILL